MQLFFSSLARSHFHAQLPGTPPSGTKPLAVPSTRPVLSSYLRMSIPPPLNGMSLMTLQLVGRRMIKKIFPHDSSSALHIAAARIVEYASASSPAQFLMVYSLSSASFSPSHSRSAGSWRRAVLLLYEWHSWYQIDCLMELCCCRAT